MANTFNASRNSQPSFQFPSSIGSSTFGSPTPKFPRHDLYYLEFVEFLIDGCLFKVPKYRFGSESSTFWRTVCPLSHFGPVRLEGIQKDDFVALLKYLYPLDIRHDTEPVTRTPDEWKSILSLIFKWNLDQHAERAMEAVKKEPLFVQVYVARACGAHEWLRSCYIALAKRDAFLSEEEARHIGLDAMIKLAHIRERHYLNPCGSTNVSYPPPVKFGRAITSELDTLKKMKNSGVRRSVAEQVMIGKQHGILEWVVQGYQMLLDRNEPLSLDEGATLGLEIATDLCQTRESRMRAVVPPFVLLVIPSIDSATEVEKEFSTELEQLKGILKDRKNGVIPK